MFSYKKGTEKSDKALLVYRKHRGKTKNFFSKMYVRKELRNKDFINKLLVDRKGNGNLVSLDYFSIKEKKIKDDINYKNSFIKKAYDNIPNATPIFLTSTLPTEYHPFIENGKKLNKEFFKGLDLDGMDLDNLDKDDIDYLLEHYDKKIYEGYKKLHNSELEFYKQEIFKKNALNRKNRARITALEPHDSLVAHLHKLEIINEIHINGYVSTLIKRHKKVGLGRTEVVMLKRSFDVVKDFLNCNFGIKKVKKDKYILKDNPQFYFKIIHDRSEDEIRTISNYMTNYLETNTIVVDDNKSEIKKPSNIYNGWAYYIAELKDKFEPKDDNKNHKKIMRIRYSNLLVSKEIYRSIFTKEVKQHLKSNGMYQKRNMYARITDLIANKDMKIYRAYKYKDEIDDKGGTITKVDKSKVMWYQVEINYKDRKDKYQSFLIDKCSNKLYRKKDDGELELLNKSEQIDLKKDNYYFDRYRFQVDRKLMMYDDDEYSMIVEEYIKKEKEKLQKK